MNTVTGRYWIAGTTALLTAIILTPCSGWTREARHENQQRNELKKVDRQFAEPDTDPKKITLSADLDSHVAYALKQNPTLRASFENWAAMVHKISSARKLPEPQISYGYFLLSVETRLGPQRHRLGLKQSFPWPTQLTAGADAISLKARAAQERFEALLLEVRAKVAAAYWRLWLIRENITIRTELLTVAQSSSDAVKARVVIGGASLAEQQQVDLFIARLEDSIESLEFQEASASAKLCAIIGAPQGTETPTSTKAPPIVLPAETNEVLQNAAGVHPLIQSFEIQAQSTGYQALSLKARRYPNFSLGLDWIEVGDTPMPDVDNSGRDALVFGVGLTIPIWQKHYRDAVEASHAEGRALRAQGRTTYENALAVLIEARLAVEDTHRRVALHKHTFVPQAEAALESLIGAYMTGRASISSIILAQRDLIELKVGLAEAQAGHATAWADLEQVVGRVVEHEIP